jgi:hypothetical protein
MKVLRIEIIIPWISAHRTITGETPGCHPGRKVSMAHRFQLAHATIDSSGGLLIANQKLATGFEKGVLPRGRFRDGVLARFQCGIVNANTGEIWRQRLNITGGLFI